MAIVGTLRIAHAVDEALHARLVREGKGDRDVEYAAPVGVSQTRRPAHNARDSLRKLGDLRTSTRKRLPHRPRIREHPEKHSNKAGKSNSAHNPFQASDSRKVGVNLRQSC